MGAFKIARLVTYGFLAGTAGLKLLSSTDFKNAYTQVTAACMRMGDTVAEKATLLKENCDDILANAKDINEKRAEEEEARKIADAKEILAAAGETVEA
jgi:hypothetical protein